MMIMNEITKDNDAMLWSLATGNEVPVGIHLHETAHWPPHDRRVFIEQLLSVHFHFASGSPIVPDSDRREGRLLLDMAVNSMCTQYTHKTSPELALSSLIFFR